MPPRDIRVLLHDIIEACAAVESLVSRATLDQYRADRHLRSSVEREFITIGEALRCATDLDETIEDDIPETRQIIGFRNNLVHRYDKIDNEVVWEIATRKAPELRLYAEQLLGEYSP